MLGILPTRIHGYLDYMMGALLVVAPLTLNFGAGVATWLPALMGCGVIVYSMLTRYELGASGLIPMPAHLMLDVMGGLLLASSPWLFGFADSIWLPHVAVGLAEAGVAVITKTRPSLVPAPEGRIGAAA